MIGGDKLLQVANILKNHVVEEISTKVINTSTDYATDKIENILSKKTGSECEEKEEKVDAKWLTALLSILVQVAFADDELQNVELDYLGEFVSDEDYDNMRELIVKIRDNPLDEKFIQDTIISVEDRLDAIRKCIDIAAIDGKVDSKEKNKIFQIADLLNQNKDFVNNELEIADSITKKIGQDPLSFLTKCLDQDKEDTEIYWKIWPDIDDNVLQKVYENYVPFEQPIAFLRFIHAPQLFKSGKYGAAIGYTGLYCSWQNMDFERPFLPYSDILKVEIKETTLSNIAIFITKSGKVFKVKYSEADELAKVVNKMIGKGN